MSVPDNRPPLNEEEIFQVAATLPAAERTAYLLTACQGQPALRGRMERLLVSHDDGEFMQRSADRDQENFFNESDTIFPLAAHVEVEGPRLLVAASMKNHTQLKKQGNEIRL